MEETKQAIDSNPIEDSNISYFEEQPAFSELLELDEPTTEEPVVDLPKPEGSEEPKLENNESLEYNSPEINSDEQNLNENQLDSNQSNDIAEAQTDDAEVEKPQTDKISIKANGQYFEFTQDELIRLAPKALNYTKKMQTIAPYRRSISAMQENGITEDDLNQFIEMKKGNKTAIANFLGKNNISTYEVADVDSQESQQYVANKYGMEYGALQEIEEELKDHPKFDSLVGYVRNLDSVSLSQIQKNPDCLRVLMNDIENGYFDKIAPEAAKRSVMENSKKPILDYYIEVANEMLEKDMAEAKAKEQQVQTQQRNEVRNKARTSGNQAYVNKQTIHREISSPLDITDEELAKFEQEIGLIY